MSKKLRVNYEIKVPMIRVIDDEGKMLGVFQVADAVKMAYEKGLDLIEIAPEANPPTCKMMDFGKYKYQLKKKAVESKKKQTVITVKEIQFRPNTDQHDIDFKTRHIEEFLAEGDKCRVIVTFRGREVTHSDLGRALLNKIIASLGDKCVIEQNPLIEGKKMSMLLGPAGSVKPVSKTAAPGAGGPRPATAGAGASHGTNNKPGPAQGAGQTSGASAAPGNNATAGANLAAGDIKK